MILVSTEWSISHMRGWWRKLHRSFGSPSWCSTLPSQCRTSACIMRTCSRTWACEASITMVIRYERKVSFIFWYNKSKFLSNKRITSFNFKALLNILNFIFRYIIDSVDHIDEHSSVQDLKTNPPQCAPVSLYECFQVCF